MAVSIMPDDEIADPGRNHMPFRLEVEPSLVFRRPTPGGLWVPGQAQRREPVSGMAFFSRAYVSYSDVYGTSPSRQDAVELLRRYDLGTILNTLGHISSAVHRVRGRELLDTQAALARHLFEDRLEPVARATIRMSQEQGELDGGTAPGPTVLLFHEQQIINAAKLALQEVPADAPLTTARPDDLGDALLMVNDLIGAPGTLNRPPSEVTTEADRREMERFFMVNGHFNHSGNPKPDLTRSWELYLSDRPHLRGSPVYLNLPELVEELTGLTAAQVWARCFAVYSHWGKDGNASSSGFPSPLQRSTHFTQEFDFTPEEEESFWSLVSATWEELREELSRSDAGTTQMDPYNLLPLERRPLVRLDDRILCPSVTLMLRRMTSGLHHLFVNHIAEESRRNQYFTYMGEVFEDYILDLLQNGFGSSAGRLIREEEIEAVVPAGTSVCDAVVAFPDGALLVEIKAKKLSLDARVRGDLSALDTVFEDVYLDSAGQIDSVVELIRSGALADLGLLPHRMNRYVPIAVTLDPLPMNPFTYDRLSRQLAEQGLLQQSNMLPLQLLGAEDIEVCATAAAKARNVLDLLAGRVASGAHRFAGLLNHLASKNDPILTGPHPHLQDRFEELADSAIALFGERRR